MTDILLDSNVVETAIFEAGLHMVGIIPLRGDDKSFNSFQQWLSEGKHAGMEYMTRHLTIRKNPASLEAGMVSTVIFALGYYQGDKLRNSSPRIAQYARFTDYHKLMKRMGEKALKRIMAAHSPELRGRVTVDSAPLLERSLAVKTGGGFIGKNTCFIFPKRGSFFLLGELHLNGIVTKYSQERSVNPDIRSADGGCGTCKRCQVNCPTGALNEDYVLDANKCLSYWTIEHRGLVPKKFWRWFDRYWFGCDICQLACPYNRGAENRSDSLPLKSKLKSLDLYQVATMDQSFYEQVFGGSPMTRAKKAGLQRNALIALFVTESPHLEKAITVIAEDFADEQILTGTIAQMGLNEDL